MTPRAVVWERAPKLALPEDPALLLAGGDLWMAYGIGGEPRGEMFAVVRFVGVIDLWQSPINDEGLGSHPYAHAGLGSYAFHEVFDTHQTIRWSVLKARHWVVTFKDVTVDVVAREAEVVVDLIRGEGAEQVLIGVVAARG